MYPCVGDFVFCEGGGVGIAAKATIPGTMKFIFKNNSIPINLIHQSIKHSMSINKISKTYNGQVHTQYLLRISKRDGQKMIKTTILNLTGFGKEAYEAMVYALKNKKSLARLIEKAQDADIVQPTTNSTTDLSRNLCPVLRKGKSIGAVWLLLRLANHISIPAALGDSHESRLALWQVLARTINQGLRLSATKRIVSS
jgi:hypothetical protein